MRNGERITGTRVRVGCDTGAVGPPAPLRRAESGPQCQLGRTFSEAVLRVFDVLSEVRDLLQEVSGVGHICCAPLRVTVFRQLQAGW